MFIARCNTITKLLPFSRMNYITDGGVYMTIEIYNYFIIPVRK